MKGINPLIASVLLIAFTVAVGGIISLWLTSFSKVMTSKAESTSIASSECAGAYFDIITVNDDNVATNGLLIAVRNSGAPNSTISSIADDVGDVNSSVGISLSLGEAKKVLLNGSSVASASKVFITGLCISSGGQTQPITGSCIKGESCWPT